MQHAEHERNQAKLWLTLYLLKIFSVTSLKMDPKIKDDSMTYAEEQ